MKLIKLFFLTFLSVFLFIVSTKNILAADLNVDCPNTPSGCSKTGVDPLFSTTNDGYWYPGLTITKTVNLENVGSSTQDFALQASRVSEVNSLEDVLQVSIFPSGGGTVIWSGSVSEFYSQGNIVLGTFAPGANLDYSISVSMDTTAGNEYQEVNTTFDLMFGFWTTSSEEEGSGSGGGEVLGTGVAAPPSCDVPTPASAPVLVSAVPGTNSIRLTWTQAINPVTYYLVAYGTSSGNYTYGNPNVGGNGTTSYTINNLSGGRTYYVVVRAGNGCKPGPFSNELSVTPGGGIVTGPATGFTEGVLGTSTSVSATPSGEVIGEQTANQSTVDKPICWWWLILSITAFFITSLKYWLWKKRHEEPKFWWVLPIVIGLLVWAGDHFIAHLYYTPSVYCGWMWLWSLLVVGIPSLAYLLF